jgi:hypothetical protein
VKYLLIDARKPGPDHEALATIEGDSPLEAIRDYMPDGYALIDEAPWHWLVEPHDPQGSFIYNATQVRHGDEAPIFQLVTIAPR